MIFEYLRKPGLNAFRASRDSFKYLEKGMKVVGWLPPAKSSRYYSIYLVWSILMISTEAIYLPIAFFASYFIDFSSFTPGDFLTSIQVAFNAAGYGFKAAVIVPRMWHFQKAKDLLDIMDKRCVRNEERIQVHRCVVYCNYIFIVYQILYTSYALLTFVSSLITGSTPWGFYNPLVNYLIRTERLWMAAIFEYIVGSGAVHSDQMADLIPLTFGIILRTHIKLLTQRILRLRTALEESDNQSYEELVNCVKDHKLILQYCNIFRPIVSNIIFAQFLVIGLSLGLSMLNILFFVTFWTGLATFVYIVVLMIETFPFCYYCELFIDDCNKLTSAIFYSNWNDANKQYKSTIFYFLHQTQQSISFIAGGIFPINMQTNIQVAKMAFSVVTIVKQMNIIEKLK